MYAKKLKFIHKKHWPIKSLMHKAGGGLFTQFT